MRRGSQGSCEVKGDNEDHPPSADDSPAVLATPDFVAVHFHQAQRTVEPVLLTARHL